MVKIEWELLKEKDNEIWFELKDGENIVSAVKVIKGETPKQTIVFFYKAINNRLEYVLGYDLDTVIKLIKKMKQIEWLRI